MNSQTPSILITDDDPQFRETLRGVFEPQGFRTLLAGSGEEALDIVKRDQVHVVLMDIHMPRLSGLETLRRLKQLRAVLPCILLSAEADETLLAEVRASQAFTFVAKPVSRRNITQVVRLAFQRTYNWPVSGGPPSHGPLSP